MKDLKFQQKAVHELVEKTIELLRLPGHRRTLMFKAPTGASKTVMASQLLADLTEELQTRGDMPYTQVAYIWIAPNKLHQQSYFKMKNYFTETHLLRAVMYDELDHAEGYIKPGEILFVNWESINKDKNVMVRDTEQSNSVYEITRRTQEEHGLPIVVIIDEEHLFWSKTADKSKQVLEKIKPKVEIRISATPKSHSDYQVTIPRESVVAEEMIKKQVVLNPDINKGYNNDTELNEHLIEKALEQRNRLAEAYKKLGVNINPLLLIQLPNDTKESMTVEDNKIAETVKAYLSANPKWNITPENGRLAVWLAGEKCNLPGIEEPDNMAEVLLFKEAIALGWDCPRAAVLLIFRKLESDTFTIQTVGRILRMPQQRHYPDGRLNVGYVYTDIAKDKIQIVAQDASYIRNNAAIAYKRKNLNEVMLPSTYSERPNAGRNYLGPDFKQTLYKTAEEFFDIERASVSLFTFEQLAAMSDEADVSAPLPKSDDDRINENRLKVKTSIRLDVKNINAEIPVDVHFQNEEQIIKVNQIKYARTMGEIDRVFITYINGKGGQFESKGRSDKIASYLLEMMADFFGIFETDAKKVILYHENKPKFDRLLNIALDRYARKRASAQAGKPARVFTDYDWTVPEERIYDNDTHHKVLSEIHALDPFYQLNQASKPEVKFATFLEQNQQYLDWWYKNGDNGKQHYAIRYTTSGGTEGLFYVDFVIRMKDGKIFLFDTKGDAGAGDIDPEVENKHNALIDYINEQNAKGQNLHEGTPPIEVSSPAIPSESMKS